MENQKESKRGIRLLLFPLPFQGHINPMLQLANILYSRGFSITIIHTHFNSPNPLNHPQFTFLPIPDGLSESEASDRDIPTLIKLMNRKCLAPFRDRLAEVLADGSGERTVCLISDALLHFTRAVSESFELPRIVLRTSSVSCFLVFETFRFLMEKGYLPVQDSQLEEPVPELPPLRFKDLPVVKNCNSEALYELAASMVKETNASSGLIWNCFEELEPLELAKHRQVCPIPNFLIGPFHRYFPASSSSLLVQDQSSISWLDRQAPKSVIYVSYGSIAIVKENEFLEMAWGLANSNHPFLWVVRPGLIRGSQWLELLPSGFLEMLGGRGHIVKWAPQQEVLAHQATAAFWTHCGWNSTLESICEGVPMICSPYFADQMMNARYVSEVWRVGLQLEDYHERGEIEEVIRRLMVEKEGEEMRERSLLLKQQVQLCLRKGGSSYQSLERLTNFILSL